MRRILSFIFALFLNVLIVEADTDCPNVVLILADDLGCGQVGFQGGTVPTPHINAIAREGVVFTTAYSSCPLCAPSRAGLLTGRAGTKFGVEFNSAIGGFHLPKTELTLGQRLQQRGYDSVCIGKWHLGNWRDAHPMARGFDEYFGSLATDRSYFHVQHFIDTRKSLDEVPFVTDPKFYSTDAYAKRAVNWIQQERNSPFFVYLAFNAVHDEYESPKIYRDRFPNLSGQELEFAAVLSAMDDAVGAVMNVIPANTLVIFTSDNGGRGRNGVFRGNKGTMSEGGIRVPFCMRWTSHIKDGSHYDLPISTLDIVPTVLGACGKIESNLNLDGVNLLPFLSGSGVPHDLLSWRMGSQFAIRRGDWKLVNSRNDNTTRLYNLRDDIRESRDLSTEFSGIRRDLQSAWDRWNAEQVAPRWPDTNRVEQK